jgi:hypothetical protein
MPCASNWPPLLFRAMALASVRYPPAAASVPAARVSGPTPKAASAPAILEDHLILSAAGPYRFVGAVFEHEGFAEMHTFARNAQGVFVLAFPIPLKRSSPLIYRLVVDGVRTTDPSNPRRRPDRAAGFDMSVAEVPYITDLRVGRYRVLAEDGRTARFLYQAFPGEMVAVCGSFNNWDPFIHEMSETSPGIYELELSLPPGTNYYAFVFRGELLHDPLNASKATMGGGRMVSVIVAESQDR